MWSDGGCSSPSASQHPSCKVESGVQKSQFMQTPSPCFPHSGILFWGVLQGTAPHRAVWCMTGARVITHTDVQPGSHRLYLSGSCEVSSCCMWSLKMSHWVMLLRPSYCQNILKQGDSLGLHDALNHTFKIETWVTSTTRHCKHTGSSLKNITVTPKSGTKTTALYISYSGRVLYLRTI